MHQILRNYDIQFNRAAISGGRPISHYVVQYDTKSTFDGQGNGLPLFEQEILTESASAVDDVQLVTIISDPGYHPGGTFVLSFRGHSTVELDYNISASGMETALEALPSVEDVKIHRELICSNEAGRNNCGDDRGYVWMVSFTNVMELGNL